MDKEINKIEINTQEIRLDQFLKWANVAASGGEAKMLITSGAVTVNDLVETRRGRKLKHNDIVAINNQQFFKVHSLA